MQCIHGKKKVTWQCTYLDISEDFQRNVHRLITIQIEHKMSSFKDLRGIRSQ